MTAPPFVPLRELARALRSDLRRGFGVLLAYEALFKLLSALVLLPALVAVLYQLVRFEGRTALTNTDILGFLLSPLGVLYAYVLGLKVLGLSMLEHAGAMALAAMKETGGWRGVRHAVVALAMRATRVLLLAGNVLVLTALALAPFAAAAALTYRGLLGEQDINFYLAERPPRFWAACGVGGLLVLGAAGLLAWLFVRWAFALPIVLFEDVSPFRVLRESAARTAGVHWRIAGLLLGWQLLGMTAQVLVVAGFKLFAGGVLTAIGRRPGAIVVEVAILLSIKLLILAVLSGLFVVGRALLLLRLYVERGVRLGVLDRAHWGDQLEEEPPQPRKYAQRLKWGVAAVVLAMVAFYLALTLPFGLRDETTVTAHRGYARHAPENSLAAFRAAIEAGADIIELDVQMTSDGEVVVLHDEDLRRMTGDKRRISRVSLEELKQIPYLPRKEYGSEVSRERVPALRDVIELAQEAGCRLNIELKFSERKDAFKDLRLARRVVEMLHEEVYDYGSIVASLHAPALREAKKHNPHVQTAAIVTAAVGDISKLDVDILSVNADLANEALLHKARRLGKQVHVWTVNHKRDMRRFIEMGVDSIITDDPELFREVREERSSLGDTQRLLLTCRYLLD
jgi:glycerophosphoryl diester phosphodiesterase